MGSCVNIVQNPTYLAELLKKTRAPVMERAYLKT